MELTPDQIRGGLHIGLDLVEVAGQMRRTAEADGLDRLRQGVERLPGGPLLKAGLGLVDLVLERRRILERDLVERARKEVEAAVGAVPGALPPVRRRPPARGARAPLLRMRLAPGRPADCVVVRLRNHRPEPERIALEVGALASAAGERLPESCARIEPGELVVPAGSVAAVQLEVDLSGRPVTAGTYAGEIRILGSTLRRVSVEIVVIDDLPEGRDRVHG